MAGWLRKLLIAPEYPGDPEKTALGRMFNIAALVLLAASVVAALNNFVAGEYRVVIVMIAAISSIALLIVAARRGRLRMASTVLPVLMLATFTVGPVIRDGVHDSATVAIAATMVVAGVLMQWRALLLLVALTIATFFAMGYAEMTGLAHNRFAGFTDVRFLFGVCISFVFAAVIVRVLTSTMIGTLRESRSAQERLKLSEERFEKIFQSSPDAIVISRLSDGRYLEVNQRWLELFGFTREEAVGRTAFDLGIWVDPTERPRFVAAVSERGAIRDFEVRFRKKSGAIIDALLSAEVIDIDGEAYLIVPIQDITDRKRLAALLDKIARGVSSRTGEEFFREMLLFLCRELPADMAFVGELVLPGDRIRTIAVCRDGELSEDFDYPLKGSPCAGVLERRGSAVYTERVAQLFPEDAGLAGRGIEGYVGTSLIDTKGKAIGILVALTRKPIERKEFFVSLVEIFAARAGAEIERSRAEERIRQLATRDGLTGLPNRLLLTDRLVLGMGNAQRNGQSLAVLFIDLDRFKYINDSLGHVVGDAFLRAVAERLSGLVRKGDTLARLGGDEFVVILEDIVAIEDVAGQVARKILASFGEPVSIGGQTLSCSCSIGISVFPSDATDPEMLIRNADTAMYHVKESGRGSYRYFSAEMNTRMQERLQIEIGLRKAIVERQFELAYQPKVNLESGKVVGLEALLRWRHPEWGVVAPGQFIAVAEDTGLIVEIGRWVLEEVCRQLREWRDRRVSPVPVAVNLSVRQFTPALVGEISTAMVAHGVAPGQIEVEITESLFMHNAEEVRTILGGLSRLGARVTIDDFGTGYSSLGYIRHFSVHALKIDRAFLSDISSSSQNLAIVRAVITMCRGLGISVVAEGVERKEQLEILRKLRCDEYQGYLFSRPVAAAEIERRHLKPVPSHKVLSGQQH